MINHQIYSSVNELPESWNAFMRHDILLQTKYFKAIENSIPNNFKLYYIGLFKDNVLVGISLIQCVQFKLEDTIRRKTNSIIRVRIKTAISRLIKGTILVVGNLTHTGQHSLFYNSDVFSKEEFLDTLFVALDNLQKQIKTETKKSVKLIMLKDYFFDDDLFSNNKSVNKLQIHSAIVQPNMIMTIRDNWQTTSDYLADMKTKYRTRYKRCKKKLGSLRKEEFNLSLVEKHQNNMYRLYRNVSDKAPFNTFILPENHFFKLKENLKENFKVYGYFDEEKLVGFYTLILNKDVLETYFLGYDNLYQQKHQLYLNMIYDMASFGIENKFESIVYARTAMEIKSTIGAKPYDMNMYMKHTSKLGNFILKSIFNFLKPKRNWEERHPFKM